MNIFLFFIVYFIQITITYPRFLSTCLSTCTLFPTFLFLFHSLTDVFLFWGPITFTSLYELYVYSIVAFFTILHWLSYGNKCILTVLLNRICGYPESRWFDSLLNRTSLRTISEYYQIYWIIGMFIIGYLLIQKKGSIS